MSDSVVELGLNPSLAEARDWLRAQLDGGGFCPCCTQYAKVYRRRIHARMAADLIRAYNTAGLGPFHLPSISGYGGDAAKLRYWGLIEEEPGIRDDGSSRVGWWRVTNKGAMFILGGSRVPKYARVFDDKLLSLTGDTVNITEALGTKFDYRTLMGGLS